MKLDPRFTLTRRELGGQLSLTISAVRELSIDEEASPLFATDLAELAGLVSAPVSFVAKASKPASRNFIINGWQSWSFGGEVASFERVRPSYIKRFCLFSQGPAAAAPRHEVMSYFYLGYRAGETRLFLLSRNSGYAPLVFRADRGGTALRVEMLAQGASYAPGEVVAELRLFCREGYFASKAAFRDTFADFRHFDRLAFLGHDGNLVPGGYESWYNHYTDISESLMEADLAGLEEPGNLVSDYYVRRGKPTIFQVDDGWERRVGDWEVDETKFPKGLALLAARIEEKGYVPGLWFAPFLVTKGCPVYRDHQDWILRDAKGRKVLAGWNPNWDGDFWTLDLSLPEVEDYLLRLFERAVEEWGYRYLKLDFLYAAFLPGKRRGGGAAFQHYDRIIGRITSRIRDKAGRPVAWLGCGAPLEVSWRHFPLMRIGADTREAWEYEVLRLVQHEGRPAAYANLLATVGRSILDGTVFVNDPDVVFCREENNRLSETEKELVGLTGFLLASQIMYSDGAAEVRSPSVRAFTARLLSAFDHLEGKDFGASRLAKAVFRLESDDGRVKGLMNLSGRPFALPAAGFDGNPIVEHAVHKAGDLVFAPHSISLYEV